MRSLRYSSPCWNCWIRETDDSREGEKAIWLLTRSVCHYFYSSPTWDVESFFSFFYTYSKVYSNSVMFIYSHTALFLCFYFFPILLNLCQSLKQSHVTHLFNWWHYILIHTHWGSVTFPFIVPFVFAMREPKYRCLYLVLLALKHLLKIMLTSPL